MDTGTIDTQVLQQLPGGVIAAGMIFALLKKTVTCEYKIRSDEDEHKVPNRGTAGTKTEKINAAGTKVQTKRSNV